RRSRQVQPGGRQRVPRRPDCGNHPPGERRMRRLAIVVVINVVVLGLAFTPRPALAQEHDRGPKKEEGFAEKHELALKWANFLLLAGLLGYFIGKNAPPF